MHSFLEQSAKARPWGSIILSNITPAMNANLDFNFGFVPEKSNALILYTNILGINNVNYCALLFLRITGYAKTTISHH